MMYVGWATAPRSGGLSRTRRAGRYAEGAGARPPAARGTLRRGRGGPLPHPARRRTRTIAVVGLAIAALGAGLLTSAPASAASRAAAVPAAGEAPGAPGAMSH